MTAEIVNPQKNQPGGKGNKSNTTNEIVYSTISNSVTGCRGRMSKILSKELTTAHTKYLVIGRRLAEYGIADLVDALIRGFKLKLNTPVLVTVGEASEILNTRSTHEIITANEISDIITQQKRYGYTNVSTLLDIANSLASTSSNPICGVIELEKQEGSEQRFRLDGSAVFKKDKFVGFLNEKETRGLNFALNKVKAGYVEVEKTKKNIVGFELINSKGKIKTYSTGIELNADIIVKNDCSLVELNEATDIMKTPGILQNYQEMENVQIQNEIQDAIYKIQKVLKVDVLKLGEEIHIQNPKAWKTVSKDWGKIFPKVKINIIVQSRIKRIGRINKSPM